MGGGELYDLLGISNSDGMKISNNGNNKIYFTIDNLGTLDNLAEKIVEKKYSDISSYIDEDFLSVDDANLALQKKALIKTFDIISSLIFIPTYGSSFLFSTALDFFLATLQVGITSYYSNTQGLSNEQILDDAIDTYKSFFLGVVVSKFIRGSESEKVILEFKNLKGNLASSITRKTVTDLRSIENKNESVLDIDHFIKLICNDKIFNDIARKRFNTEDEINSFVRGLIDINLNEIEKFDNKYIIEYFRYYIERSLFLTNLNLNLNLNLNENVNKMSAIGVDTKLKYDILFSHTKTDAFISLDSYNHNIDFLFNKQLDLVGLSDFIIHESIHYKKESIKDIVTLIHDSFIKSDGRTIYLLFTIAQYESSSFANKKIESFHTRKISFSNDKDAITNLLKESQSLKNRVIMKLTLYFEDNSGNSLKETCLIQRIDELSFIFFDPNSGLITFSNFNDLSGFIFNYYYHEFNGPAFLNFEIDSYDMDSIS